MDVRMADVYNMKKSKKGMSKWMWILIILILIALGIGIYFWLGTGGIPQPPALPK